MYDALELELRQVPEDCSSLSWRTRGPLTSKSLPSLWPNTRECVTRRHGRRSTIWRGRLRSGLVPPDDETAPLPGDRVGLLVVPPGDGGSSFEVQLSRVASGRPAGRSPATRWPWGGPSSRHYEAWVPSPLLTWSGSTPCRRTGGRNDPPCSVTPGPGGASTGCGQRAHAGRCRRPSRVTRPQRFPRLLQRRPASSTTSG